MPKMLKIRETRRNILRMWSYVTGYYRRGPEAGRGTNQQPKNDLRPDVALKETQRGRRYGKSEESQKIKKAIDYLGSAKKRNDRGVPNAPAPTRIHADRCGSI